MGDVVKLPEAEEAYPMICENCANWDLIQAHFFIYEDGSFRCTQCGAGYVFKQEQEDDQERD